MKCSDHVGSVRQLGLSEAVNILADLNYVLAEQLKDEGDCPSLVRGQYALRRPLADEAVVVPCVQAVDRDCDLGAFWCEVGRRNRVVDAIRDLDPLTADREGWPLT